MVVTFFVDSVGAFFFSKLFHFYVKSLVRLRCLFQPRQTVSIDIVVHFFFAFLSTSSLSHLRERTNESRNCRVEMEEEEEERGMIALRYFDAKDYDDSRF